jgi:hypothetical protein
MAVAFLSSHGNVVVYLDEHPDTRVREIADGVGITERAAYTIVSELSRSGTYCASVSADAIDTRSLPADPCATPRSRGTRSVSCCAA